jgi:acyl carrier protein
LRVHIYLQLSTFAAIPVSGGKSDYDVASQLALGSDMLARVDAPTAVLQLLRRFAPSLPSLDSEASVANLPDAGLTSMAAVKLMLALEAEFGIAIPDDDLTPENFATLGAIVALVTRVRGF